MQKNLFLVVTQKILTFPVGEKEVSVSLHRFLLLILLLETVPQIKAFMYIFPQIFLRDKSR